MLGFVLMLEAVGVLDGLRASDWLKLFLLSWLVTLCAFGAVFTTDVGSVANRHCVGTKRARRAVDWLQSWLPASKVLLSLVEDFSCSLPVLERVVAISGYDRSIVEQVQQLSCVLSQQDLLLGTLDDGSGVNVISLLELLARDVGKLSFGNERLGFGADEFLLELDDLGRGRLLVLQLLNFVLNLSKMSVQTVGVSVCFMSTYLRLGVPRRLNGALGVPNLLQETSAVLQALSKGVLLLCNLSQQHAELVGYVGDSIVASLLTPVAKLRGDGCLLLRCVLVGSDGVVLGLDQLVQLLGEVGLLDAAETGHGEAVLSTRLLLAACTITSLRTNGQRSVPASACQSCSRSERNAPVHIPWVADRHLHIV